MEEEAQPSQMMVPMGRALLPGELEESKAKGREWSQMVKVKGRRILTPEEVEDRRLKNRTRQKRFRERQKTKEAEEEARSNATYHTALGAHHAQMTEDHSLAHHEYPSENDLGYDVAQPQHQEQAPLEEEHRVSPGNLHQVDEHGESLAEKRKRLGRERQARFREKKRARTAQAGDMLNGDDSASPREHHRDVQIADIQKISAQMSGYYLGLTPGFNPDEHHAVMKFFFDNLREDLGDEVMSGVVNYMYADAHAAAAAAAHVQYVNQGIVQGLAQGMDLQTLQAAAAVHIAQQDMQAHLHAQHPMAGDAGSQHMQEQMEHMGMIPPISQGLMQKNEMLGSQLDYQANLQPQHDPGTQDIKADVPPHQAGVDDEVHHHTRDPQQSQEEHSPGGPEGGSMAPEGGTLTPDVGHAMAGEGYGGTQVSQGYPNIASDGGYTDEEVHAHYGASAVDR